jgi:hypothetical protein
MVIANSRGELRLAGMAPDRMNRGPRGIGGPRTMRFPDHVAATSRRDDTSSVYRRCGGERCMATGRSGMGASLRKTAPGPGSLTRLDRAWTGPAPADQPRPDRSDRACRRGIAPSANRRGALPIAAQRGAQAQRLRKCPSWDPRRATSGITTISQKRRSVGGPGLLSRPRHKAPQQARLGPQNRPVLASAEAVNAGGVAAQ